MTVYSSLVRLSPRLTSKVFFRQSSDHRVFPLGPSRFQWKKFKDHLHFYTLLGLIPCGLVLLYANVFIGPATLSEIPEDYEPKYWEYTRHPVSRFIAKYILPSPQQEYEKYLAFIFMENEKAKLRTLVSEIEETMSERADYQVYYYRPVMSKYFRRTREEADKMARLQE